MPKLRYDNTTDMNKKIPYLKLQKYTEYVYLLSQLYKLMYHRTDSWIMADRNFHRHLNITIFFVQTTME